MWKGPPEQRTWTLHWIKEISIGPVYLLNRFPGQGCSCLPPVREPTIVSSGPAGYTRLKFVSLWGYWTVVEEDVSREVPGSSSFESRYVPYSQ